MKFPVTFTHYIDENSPLFKPYFTDRSVTGENQCLRILARGLLRVSLSSSIWCMHAACIACKQPTQDMLLATSPVGRCTSDDIAAVGRVFMELIGFDHTLSEEVWLQCLTCKQAIAVHASKL